ncbi:trifunctional purine biosynthetic protein adenosine-3 [Cebus imitator]|uniref:trifunctional purine biosynthetic protein adenosine-3 n=1 Tax=Cebus imitator TaxID=2715852 RepID=UPI001896C719|nr:trifunctional purine biosynthetic protein adenosine-3 [Cebus imitator]
MRFHFPLEFCFADRAMAARVLVIGSGGREHTLAWKLAQSNHVKHVLVAPGNAGTACSEKISNTAVSISDHTALAQFCKDEKIEFVVVGPEAPLAAGIVGNLMSAGVRCFGPTAEAAQLESSKRFAKDFMDRHGIPTAQWKAFTKPEEACSFIMSADFPALVVKASGLAAGKGVIVAKTKEEACKAVQEIMQEKAFGVAGETIVIEELLDGEEVSCLCFTDGKTVAPMPPAQDHKRLLEGDGGPNTGGMGAYCPAPQVLPKDSAQVLQQEGIPYTGILYAGIMLTKDGPKVLEFNCRFGDPECQVILPLLKSDLYEVIQSTLDGLLCTSLPVWLENHTALTVVMASKGYPGDYSTGVEITGFPEAQAQGLEVFHAGTALKNGKVVTQGGRVLAVTAIRENLVSALEEAKKGLAAIKFEGAIYRKDIGFRAIAFLQHPR